MLQLHLFSFFLSLSKPTKDLIKATFTHLQCNLHCHPRWMQTHMLGILLVWARNHEELHTIRILGFFPALWCCCKLNKNGSESWLRNGRNLCVWGNSLGGHPAHTDICDKQLIQHPSAVQLSKSNSEQCGLSVLEQLLKHVFV